LTQSTKRPEIRLIEFADDTRVRVWITPDQWGNVPHFVRFRDRVFTLCTDGIYHELLATMVPESAIVTRGRPPKQKGQR
jgi:hypothetical protein